MKRSAQVALVLMSAAAVGGTAYSMMPAENCVQPGSTAPSTATPNSGVMTQSSQSCSTRRSWTSYFRSGRPLFFGGSNNNSSSGTSPLGFTSSNNTSSTTTTSRTSIGGTQRGGFGSTSSSMSSRGS